jgi:hypothetical protein
VKDLTTLCLSKLCRVGKVKWSGSPLGRAEIPAGARFLVWLGQVSGAVLSLEHMTEVAGGPCLRLFGSGGFLFPLDALLLLWRGSQNISGALV